MSRVPSLPFDALIVGSGLHGCMVALTLARAGMKTALLERGALCREASGVNAGTLTMQMTRVALIPYAMKGHEMWATARDWLGDVGTVVCDGLSLAFTESEAELLTLRAVRRREAGAPIGIISIARAQEIEPALSDHPVLATHCPIDGYTSGIYIARLLAERMLDRAPAMPLFPIDRLLACAANGNASSALAARSSVPSSALCSPDRESKTRGPAGR